MNVICTAVCLLTTAELVCPKNQVKTVELSTNSLGYMMDKRSNRWGANQRLRVFFDSGCGATLINKSLSNTGKSPETIVLNGQQAQGAIRQPGDVKLNLHYQPFTQIETYPVKHMWMNHHMRRATMT